MTTFLKTHWRLWIPVLLGAGLILIVLVLLPRSPVPATPAVSWTPSSVMETVLAGDTVTVPVSFTASRNLNNVLVHVVPELQSLVDVTPLVLGNITTGETIFLDLVVSPPISALPEAVQGTIQIRSEGSARTFAVPLPVTVTVEWLVFESDVGDYVVNFPPTFDIGELVSPAREFEQPELISFVSVDAPGTLPGTFTISVFSNPRLLSIADWVEENRPGFYRGDVAIFNITICGVPGLDYSSVEGTKRGVYFVKNGSVYALEWHGYSDEQPDRLSEFEEMVSSFSCI